MASFILFFKKFPAFTITLFLVILIEIILRFIPRLEYLEAGGSFFTYYKRNIAENPNLHYDILLFGDSRSLALKGYHSEKFGYSIYNFSLPAAGPRYVKFFLKKYINHGKKPRLVIWAIDPEQLSSPKLKAFDTDKKLWEGYKHRLLNLFSFSESMEQYSGREFLFIAKEYLPNIFYTFRYRLGFQDLLTGLKLEVFREAETFHTKQNKLIEKIASNNLGQINLGEFFIADKNAALQGYNSSLANLDKIVEFSLEPLNQFIEYAFQNEIKVAILMIPKANRLYDSKMLKNILPTIKEKYTNKKNILYLEFPNLNYPLEYFSEGIHYNNEGGKVLNDEYEKYIIPEIIEFTKGEYEK